MEGETEWRRMRGFIIQAILLISLAFIVFGGYRFYLQKQIPKGDEPHIGISPVPAFNPIPIRTLFPIPLPSIIQPALESNEKVIKPIRESKNPVLFRSKKERVQEEPLDTEIADSDDVLLWDDYGGKYSSEVVKGKVICDRIEYRGRKFLNNTYSKKELNTVLNFFHEAQRLLVDWVNRQQELPPETIAIMKTLIHNLRLIFPPPLEQPDLTWRGIGIWTHSSEEGPAIQLGSGYVKLVFRYPKRALFEMTRLVAQSWMPCELKRRGAQSPWNSLLECLQIRENEVCNKRGYSTTGWAISSILAYSVASPGCTLPAFLDEKKARCFQFIDKVTLPFLDLKARENREKNRQ